MIQISSNLLKRIDWGAWLTLWRRDFSLMWRQRVTLLANCPSSEFLWSVFSHIWTKYGLKNSEYGHFSSNVKIHLFFHAPRYLTYSLHRPQVILRKTSKVWKPPQGFLYPFSVQLLGAGRADLCLENVFF